MRVVVEIHCENDSFGESRAEKLLETAVILNRLARELRGTCGDPALTMPGSHLHDRNGNTIGSFRVEE